MASVPSSVSKPGAPSDFASLATMYYSMEIVAVLLLGIGIIPALFFGRISRTTTWYSFMLSWMWYCVTNLILAGHQSQTEPPFSMCLVQAGLIYAAPVFVSATGLAFIIELYLRVHFGLYGLTICRVLVATLVAFPLFLNLTVFLEVIIYGTHNKTSVRRNSTHLYCHIETGIQNTFASILVILLLVPTIAIEALTASILYRKVKNMPVKPKSPFSLTLFIRAVFFTFIASVGITIGAVGLGKYDPNWQKFQTAAQASVPLCAALVFLTQMDIVQSWSSHGSRSATQL
ncbi:hypothetical protein DFH09DRAFT_1137161 [Mycena vulgaris]|nr:hypothetical protein DFH09DRAFT_1137161 [Mycena vulgaris]